MSKSLITILEIAAGVIVSLIIIGFIFKKVNSTLDTAGEATAKAEKEMSAMLNSDKTAYDGAEVTGSEVLHAITKFKGEEFGVLVCTKKDTSGTYYGWTLRQSGSTYDFASESSSKIADAKKTSSRQYINPTGTFTGECLYDVNQQIIGVKFTQK